jgi:transposase
MKYTFKDFSQQYATDDACLDAIMERNAPGKRMTCPECGVIDTLFHKITGRRAYVCQECGHHHYPCAGTIFEHSSTPLTLWFHAMYLMTATRNGVSGKELQRQLGVTYKCAWRIGHQLRILMAARDKANTPPQLSGHVEVDETYIGGRVRGKSVSVAKKAKTVVMGMVERGGAIKGRVVEDAKKRSLIPVLLEGVKPGTMVNTDTLSSYRDLAKLGYRHEMLNHQAEEWARGIHSTNRIEGFWSHLKRGISSTHVSISKKHAQKYVDEFAFRYNNRHTPADMFARMLKQVSSPNK